MNSPALGIESWGKVERNLRKEIARMNNRKLDCRYPIGSMIGHHRQPTTAGQSRRRKRKQ